MTIRPSACSAWAEVSDVRGCAPCASVGDDEDDAISDDAIDEAIDIATDILFQLSGKKFAGICSEAVRPCRRHPSWKRDRFIYNYGISGYGAFEGSWLAWGIQDSDCERYGDRACGCGNLSEITLGAYPLREIDRVFVDGVQLNASDYRIDDNRFLVRVDGQCWPCCQDLTKDPYTEEDTFIVEFKYGAMPPPSGVRAASKLACEIARSCAGASCDLPARVQSINRQGLSIALLDPFDFLTEGRTGIYEVDLFLQAHNPNKLQSRAAVLSPDIGWPVRRTGTESGS